MVVFTIPVEKKVHKSPGPRSGPSSQTGHSVETFVPFLALLKDYGAHHSTDNDAQESTQQQQEHSPPCQGTTSEISSGVVHVVCGERKREVSVRRTKGLPHNWSPETGLRSFQQSCTALGSPPTHSNLADQPKTCVLYLHWQGGRVLMKSTENSGVELGRPQDSPISCLALWLPWVPTAYHCSVTPLKDRAELGTEWKLWRSHPLGECP